MKSQFLGTVAGFLLATSLVGLAQITGGGGSSGGGGSGTPGGSDTQVQYNMAGSFGGISGATTDGAVLTLVAPVLGAATATTINRVTITAPATAATLTIINNKVFTVNKTLTLDGTDSTVMTFPSTSATIARTDAANTFTGHQTIEGVATAGATGTGNLVFATTPTLTTPVLGVATATSINGNTFTTGTYTLTGVAGKTLTFNKSLTLEGTDSTTMTFPTTSATIARTDAANTFTGHQTVEGVTSTGATGTGKFVFDGTPTLVTPVLGVATATSINGLAITTSTGTLTITNGKTLTDTSAVGAVLLKGATGGGFAAAVAADIPATTLATGTSVSLTAPKQFYICTSTCTVTPPVPAAGYEFCVINDDNVATVITMAALGSSARYEVTARTSYGTASTGTAVSGGAVGDKICIVGLDSTHYITSSYNGVWTMN